MNFIELLEQQRIPYEGESHRHGRQGWVQIDCPFCGPGSGKFHLGFNLAHGYLNCWRCGPHNLFEVVALLLDSKQEAYRFVSQLEKVSPKRDGVQFKRRDVVLPFNPAALLPVHLKYLRSRGFNPAKIERLWGVQGIGLEARLAWRLFIPVLRQAKLVTWTTRSVSDTAALRYVSAAADQEILSIKSLLYGADYARHTIIVCEGPLDAWKVGPGAVALCGVNYSMAQVAEIVRYPRRVICFDNELAAQRRAADLTDLIAPFDGQTWNVTLDAKDPASATLKEIKALRSSFL